MLREVIQIARCSLSFQIRLVSEETKPQLAIGLHDVVFILGFAPGAKCDVRFCMFKLQKCNISQQGNPCSWMLLSKRAEGRHKHVGNGEQRGHDYVARKLGVLYPNLAGEILQYLMRTACNAEEFFASFCQLISATVANEEPDAQLLFKSFDVTIHSGAMHTQDLGSFADGAFFGDEKCGVNFGPGVHLPTDDPIEWPKKYTRNHILLWRIFAHFMRVLEPFAYVESDRGSR